MADRITLRRIIKGIINYAAERGSNTKTKHSFTSPRDCYNKALKEHPCPQDESQREQWEKNITEAFNQHAKAANINIILIIRYLKTCGSPLPIFRNINQHQPTPNPEE